MGTRIDVNEVFDPEGNLIGSEEVIVEVPDEPIVELVGTLTDEQKAALLQALQGV